jgi:hypothetical protein
VTSGMTAKGGALGTSYPEGGASVNRARKPDGRSRNGKKRDAAAVEEPIADDMVTADAPLYPVASSVRTLILGIDYDGRIVQHDRTAPQILARKPEELLGAQLGDLTASTSDGTAAISGLLEAIRSDREGSAMLTIVTTDGPQTDAVVTMHPMRASGTSLAALAMLRIPVPNSERFVDPAVMRRHMLDDTFTRIGEHVPDVGDAHRRHARHRPPRA